MISNCYFNGAQNFLAHFADRRPQHCYGFRGIPVENGQKILMDKAFVGIAPAAGQQGVFSADGGGLSEGSSDVEFIVPFQIAFVNDAEDLPAVIKPLIHHQLLNSGMNLFFQTPGDVVAVLQRTAGGFFILFRKLPLREGTGSSPCARVRNIEHIAEFGFVPGNIQQGDSFGAPADIAAHPVIPDPVIRAGGRLRALSIDHELFMIGIFV